MYKITPLKLMILFYVYNFLSPCDFKFVIFRNSYLSSSPLVLFPMSFGLLKTCNRLFMFYPKFLHLYCCDSLESTRHFLYSIWFPALILFEAVFHSMIFDIINLKYDWSIDLLSIFKSLVSIGRSSALDFCFIYYLYITHQNTL